MNFLITGASGFKGRHLIRNLLRQGNDISALVLTENEDLTEFPQVNKICCDLSEYDNLEKSLQKAGPIDGVFHFAALSSVHLSWKNPGLTYRNNLEATANLTSALNIHDSPPLLFVSSGEIYGKNYKSEINELTPPAPANPYAFSKLFAEKHCKTFYPEHVIARPFSIIGEGQSSNFVIPSFCLQTAKIIKGYMKPEITVGNIYVKRNFLSIDDAVNAYILIMQNFKKGAVYNIAGTSSISLSEIITFLEEIAAVNFSISVDKSLLRPNDPDIPQIKTDNLQNLGWQQTSSIKNTLKKIVNYYLENI